ncbi:hypothetical protein [Haloarchaeobius amylolyticus]|uniref:hypothetical protein n=1 Tax=Haloarchaeobius amylolyticus TaxID=1198296 RepID=UPI002271DEBF|nr:hypothetical protein [Haloarchaeobius amylolyticus]
MGEIWGDVVEAVAGLHPRVRRRRREYREIAQAIDQQDVPARSFRCDGCGRVQSRHAASALVTDGGGEGAPGVWCVTCVEETARNQSQTRTLAGIER